MIIAYMFVVCTVVLGYTFGNCEDGDFNQVLVKVRSRSPVSLSPDHTCSFIIRGNAMA